MKLYNKLAKEGILKNKDIYFPYILIFSLFVAIFNINLLLLFNKSLDNYYGMTTVKTVLYLASIVIGFFSIIFLYYADGFLLDRRLKEVSLYAILGIDKSKIILIMSLESVIISGFGIFIGFITSTIFYKISEAIFFKMMKLNVNFNLNMSLEAYFKTILLFIFISILIVVSRVIKIKNKSILELFKEDKTFKKVKYLKLKSLISAILLIVGYTIAIKIENPISALRIFVVDVLIVILATLFLFESLSIFVLEKLKNSKIYYKKNNFMSISGLIFRLKSNAKGLANICIMSCGIIVLLGSAFTLYGGVKNNIDTKFVREIIVETSDLKTIEISDRILNENNIKKLNVIKYKSFSSLARIDDNTIILDKNIKKLSEANLIGVIEKNSVDELKDMELKNDEVFIYSNVEDLNSIRVGDQNFKIKKYLKDISLEKPPKNLYINLSLIVVENIKNFVPKNDRKNIIFNEKFDLEENDREVYLEKIRENKISNEIISKNAQYEESKSFYGAIFFIGIFLGVVFILGTLLIIYYKNLQEGYADREKYKILREVGMTDGEIKKSIDTQVRIFFLFPVLISGVHILFAFPLISKLFVLGGFLDEKSKIFSFVIVYLIFLISYLIYYKLTSRVYYKIIKN